MKCLRITRIPPVLLFLTAVLFCSGVWNDICVSVVVVVDAFVVIPGGTTIVTTGIRSRTRSSPSSSSSSSSFESSSSALNAKKAEGGKKKKRKRKKSAPVGSAAAPTTTTETKPTATKPPPPKTSKSPPSLDIPTVMETNTIAEETKVTTPPVTTTASTGNGQFKFDRNEAIALGITDAEADEDIIPQFAPLKPLSLDEGAIELPSFGDAVKKRQQKKDPQITEEEEEEEETEVFKKIDRSDIFSFNKLLEVEPNADTDASFFLAEDYGIVSALLAEGSKSFLGIPSGPLQVGHFIGSLGIILMAFVNYPGFPLTNLPSPLRGALQGGLGTVYTINIILAILATFQAGERGQPKVLWAAKCVSVGGLAFDQLTQLPTTKEIEARKSKKGKRALKKNNK